MATEEEKREKRRAYFLEYYKRNKEKIKKRVKYLRDSGIGNAERNRALRVKYDDDYRERRMATLKAADQRRKEKRARERQAKEQNSDGQNEPT